MAAIINLTGQQSVTVNVGSINSLVVPPLSNSLDVSGFDMLDFQFAISQMAPATIILFIISSMQNDVDDVSGTNYLPTTLGYSWLTAASWIPASSMPQFVGMKITQGFYRWLRWGLVSTSGTGNVTFWMRGMGRSYGGGMGHPLAVPRPILPSLTESALNPGAGIGSGSDAVSRAGSPATVASASSGDTVSPAKPQPLPTHDRT